MNSLSTTGMFPIILRPEEFASKQHWLNFLDRLGVNPKDTEFSFVKLDIEPNVAVTIELAWMEL
jgi:hypothetical protein